MKKICAIIFLALISVLGVGSAVRIGLYALPDYRSKNADPISLVKMFVTDTDNNLQQQMLCRGNWIDLFGGVMRLTGADVIADVAPENAVYKMQNGSVTFIISEDRPMDTAQLSSIRELRDAADAAGAASWFVSIPQKTCTRDPALTLKSRGVTDYTESIDAYRRQVFADSGFSVLDLHEAMHAQPGLHEQFYFKTDHHWTPEAGLWAARQIADALSLPTAPLDTVQYSARLYPRLMLGTQGKRCGRLYCACEDMSVPIPQTDDTFTVYIEGEGTQQGSFSDVMLFARQFKEHENVYDITPYGLILHGDHPFVSIRNEQNPDGAKVLVLKDSFSNAFAPYLALVCAQVDMIDTRDYTDDVTEWIRQNKPDAVLVTMSAKIKNDSFVFSGKDGGS